LLCGSLLLLANAIELGSSVRRGGRRSSSSSSLASAAATRLRARRRATKFIDATTPDPDTSVTSQLPGSDGGGDPLNTGNDGNGNNNNNIGGDFRLKDHCGARNRGLCKSMAMCNGETDMKNKDCNGDISVVCCYECGSRNAKIDADRCGSEANSWAGYCMTWTTCVGANAGDAIDINTGTRCPITCTGTNEICCSVKNIWKKQASADDQNLGAGDNTVPSGMG